MDQDNDIEIFDDVPQTARKNRLCRKPRAVQSKAAAKKVPVDSGLKEQEVSEDDRRLMEAGFPPGGLDAVERSQILSVLKKSMVEVGQSCSKNHPRNNFADTEGENNLVNESDTERYIQPGNLGLMNADEDNNMRRRVNRRKRHSLDDGSEKMVEKKNVAKKSRKQKHVESLENEEEGKGDGSVFVVSSEESQEPFVEIDVDVMETNPETYQDQEPNTVETADSDNEDLEVMAKKKKMDRGAKKHIAQVNVDKQNNDNAQDENLETGLKQDHDTAETADSDNQNLDVYVMKTKGHCRKKKNQKPVAETEIDVENEEKVKIRNRKNRDVESLDERCVSKNNNKMSKKKMKTDIVIETDSSSEGFGANCPEDVKESEKFKYEKADEEQSDSGDVTIIEETIKSEVETETVEEETSIYGQTDNDTSKAGACDSDVETQPPESEVSDLELHMETSTMDETMQRDGSDLEQTQMEEEEDVIQVLVHKSSSHNNGPTTAWPVNTPESQHSGGFEPGIEEEAGPSYSTAGNQQEEPDDQSGSSQGSTVDEHGELVRHYRAVRKQPYKKYPNYRLDGEDRAACLHRLEWQFQKFRERLREAQQCLQPRMFWEDWPTSVKSGPHQTGTLDHLARGKPMLNANLSDEEGTSTETMLNPQKRQTRGQRVKPDVFSMDVSDGEDFESLTANFKRRRNMKKAEETAVVEDDDLPELVVENEGNLLGWNKSGTMKKNIMEEETQEYEMEADKENKESHGGRHSQLNNGKKTVKISDYIKLGQPLDHPMRSVRGRGLTRGVSVPIIARVGTRQNAGRVLVEETQDVDEDDAQLQEAIRRSKAELVIQETQFQDSQFQENDTDFLDVKESGTGQMFGNNMQKAKLAHFSIPKVGHTRNHEKVEKIETAVTDGKKDWVQEKGVESNEGYNEKSKEHSVKTIGNQKRGRKKKVQGVPLVLETQDIDGESSGKRRSRIKRKTFKLNSESSGNSEEESVPETQELDMDDISEMSGANGNQIGKTGLNEHDVGKTEPVYHSVQHGKGYTLVTFLGAVKSKAKALKDYISPSKPGEENGPCDLKRKADADEEAEGSQSPVLKNKKKKRLGNPASLRLRPAFEEDDDSNDKEVGHGNIGSDERCMDQGLTSGGRRFVSRPESHDNDSRASDDVSVSSSSQRSGAMLDDHGYLYSTQIAEIRKRTGRSVKARGKKVEDLVKEKEDEKIQSILSLDESDDEQDQNMFKYLGNTYSRKGNRYGKKELTGWKTEQFHPDTNNEGRTVYRNCTSTADLDLDINQSGNRLPSLDLTFGERAFQWEEAEGSTPARHAPRMGPEVKQASHSQDEPKTMCPLCSMEFFTRVIEEHAATCDGTPIEGNEVGSQENRGGQSAVADSTSALEDVEAEVINGMMVCIICDRRYPEQEYKEHFHECCEQAKAQQAGIEAQGYKAVEPTAFEPRTTRAKIRNDENSPTTRNRQGVNAPATRNRCVENSPAARARTTKRLSPTNTVSSHTTLVKSDSPVSIEIDDNSDPEECENPYPQMPLAREAVGRRLVMKPGGPRTGQLVLQVRGTNNRSDIMRARAASVKKQTGCSSTEGHH